MKYIIDRFEGEYAVIELDDMSTMNMNKKLLPKESKEGDVIEISIDKDETAKRKEKIGKLMNKLFED